MPRPGIASLRGSKPHPRQVNCIRHSPSARVKSATPVLDGTNPHFQSRYVTLSGLWKVARAPLEQHGLAVVQAPRRDGLTTRLTHSSGKWLEFDTTLDVGNPAPQALGSLTTYLRRYALASLLGIVGELDDDGNAAQAAKPAKSTSGPTPLQIKRLYALIKENDLDEGRVKDFVRRAYGANGFGELTPDAYQRLCDKLPDLRAQQLAGEDIPF